MYAKYKEEILLLESYYCADHHVKNKGTWNGCLFLNQMDILISETTDCFYVMYGFVLFNLP